MTPHHLYRVVGVRHNGSRLLICEHVTKSIAEKAQATASNGGAFMSVVIETIEEHPTLDLKPTEDASRKN